MPNFLYYCNTPYQVLNALNLNFNRRRGFENYDHYYSELYIVDQFSTAGKLYSRLKEDDEFDLVSLLRREDTKEKTYINKVLQIAYDTQHPERLLKHMMGLKKEELPYNRFDYVMSSFSTHSVASLLQINPKAQYVMFEDGLGSYIGNSILQARSIPYRILVGIKSNGNRIEHPSAIYLNNVELCSSSLTKDIKKAPVFTEEFLNYLRVIFDVDDSYKKYERFKIWWLGQPLDSDQMNKISTVLSNSLIRYSENTVVRAHPREKENNKYKSFTQDSGKCLWEIQIRLTNNFNEKILIAVNSTALFTPKILFDYEPKLIFLQHLLNDDQNVRNDFDNILNKFRKYYRDPDKIFVPDTEQELDRILQNLMQ